MLRRNLSLTITTFLIIPKRSVIKIIFLNLREMFSVKNSPKGAPINTEMEGGIKRKIESSKSSPLKLPNISSLNSPSLNHTPSLSVISLLPNENLKASQISPIMENSSMLGLCVEKGNHQQQHDIVRQPLTTSPSILLNRLLIKTKQANEIQVRKSISDDKSGQEAERSSSSLSHNSNENVCNSTFSTEIAACIPKTPAQRAREYRLRKKLRKLANAVQSASSSVRASTSLRKSSAQRSREYRQRKKEREKALQQPITISSTDVRAIGAYKFTTSTDLYQSGSPLSPTSTKRKLAAERSRRYRRRKKERENLLRTAVESRISEHSSDSSISTVIINEALGVNIVALYADQSSVSPRSSSTTSKRKSLAERTRKCRKRKKDLENVLNNFTKYQAQWEQQVMGRRTSDEDILYEGHYLRNENALSEDNFRDGEKLWEERIEHFVRGRINSEAKGAPLVINSENARATAQFDFINIDLKYGPICDEDQLTYENIANEIHVKQEQIEPNVQIKKEYED